MSRENAAPEASPNEASAPKPNPLAKAKSFDGVENSFVRCVEIVRRRARRANAEPFS